jgi:hypothetical protein
VLPYYVLEEGLAAAHVTARQVEAVWVKQANACPSAGFPAPVKSLQADLTAIDGRVGSGSNSPLSAVTLNATPGSCTLAVGSPPANFWPVSILRIVPKHLRQICHSSRHGLSNNLW